MLDTVTAVRFDRAMKVGKTGPCLLACSRADGSEVEVVAKFRAGCEMGNRSLVTEAIVAMLAADVGLPVPEPFVVVLDADFANTITDPPTKAKALASLGHCFGSKRLPPAFASPQLPSPLPKAMAPQAAEILAFDTFIANQDRRVSNPNLLVRGHEIAIFDHELALFTEGLLGWIPPWEPGGIHFPLGQSPAQQHVFVEPLRATAIDITRLVTAIGALTDARLAEYRTALPPEWIEMDVAVGGILDYIRTLRDNIAAASQNFVGALV